MKVKEKNIVDAEVVENLQPKLTPEEMDFYNNKCIELAKKYNVSKVYAYIAIKIGTKERIVSYLKEPNYMSKLALMDKASTIGANMAGDEMRNLCQLRDESHPLTFGESSECDEYKIGIVNFCIENVKYYINAFKKK